MPAWTKADLKEYIYQAILRDPKRYPGARHRLMSLDQDSPPEGIRRAFVGFFSEYLYESGRRDDDYTGGPADLTEEDYRELAEHVDHMVRLSRGD